MFNIYIYIHIYIYIYIPHVENTSGWERWENSPEANTSGHSRWLIVDATLEASGAPVHELDGSLGLDGCNGRVHILWHHISFDGHIAAAAWM